MVCVFMLSSYYVVVAANPLCWCLMLQTMAHNPRSQPPYVHQHPLGYRTLLEWADNTVDATERQIVASEIWLLVLQPDLLCCCLFPCFPYEVISANYGINVSLHFAVSNHRTFHNLCQYMATVSTHTDMSSAMQLNLGYIIPLKMNINLNVNVTALLFRDDGKAGFKFRKTPPICIVYCNTYSNNCTITATII